jgi:hypothetical protein
MLDLSATLVVPKVQGALLFGDGVVVVEVESDAITARVLRPTDPKPVVAGVPLETIAYLP